MKRCPKYGEFIALTAIMISITALAIDMMLPALPDIRRNLGVAHANDVQLVISIFLLGLGIGQLLLGPVSDCFGRKPVIFAGFLIFTIGCLMSNFSTRFEVMLVGRIIQGIGAAGPRTTIVALIRDQYSGRTMARIMSAVLAVFIIAPTIAPSLGQVILIISSWRAIFSVLMILGLLTLTWFTIRQPETLPRNQRIRFSIGRVVNGVFEVCSNRRSLGYTLASGLIYGALIGYLNSAQQIFQEVYGLGRLFPLYMAVITFSAGIASFINSRIVVRFGMRSLTQSAILLFIVVMTLYLIVTFQMDGHSPLWLMMICMATSFFCMGMIFGNLNALAMEPLGHIAGIGSAVIGSLTSLISSPVGTVIGRFYNGSTLPLACGFVILGILTAAAMFWANGNRLGFGKSR